MPLRNDDALWDHNPGKQTKNHENGQPVMTANCMMQKRKAIEKICIRTDITDHSIDESTAWFMVLVRFFARGSLTGMPFTSNLSKATGTLPTT